jgi:hypothetical protein
MVMGWRINLLLYQDSPITVARVHDRPVPNVDFQASWSENSGRGLFTDNIAGLRIDVMLCAIGCSDCCGRATTACSMPLITMACCASVTSRES